MGASDPTTRSAGEAVMEKRSMDNLARFQRHRINFKRPVNRPICLSLFNEPGTQHKNVRREFSPSPHLLL